MARQIQSRRGSADEHANFTGAIGEITMDTTKKTLRVHDGQTPGGYILATEGQLGAKANSQGNNIDVNQFLSNLGFGNRHLQIPGYYKLPGGLIIQWGEDTDSGTKYFPIAFPNKPLTAAIAPNMIGGEYWYGQSFAIVSNTQYNVTLVNCSKIKWFAIGY